MKGIFDYSDGDLCHEISDGMFMDSEGNIMQSIGGNMAMESGDLHYLSGDSDPFDDED